MLIRKEASFHFAFPLRGECGTQGGLDAASLYNKIDVYVLSRGKDESPFHSPANCHEELIRQGTFPLAVEQGAVMADKRSHTSCGAQTNTDNGNTTTY